MDNNIPSGVLECLHCKHVLECGADRPKNVKNCVRFEERETINHKENVRKEH